MKFIRAYYGEWSRHGAALNIEIEGAPKGESELKRMVGVHLRSAARFGRAGHVKYPKAASFPQSDATGCDCLHRTTIQQFAPAAWRL